MKEVGGEVRCRDRGTKESNGALGALNEDNDA